MIVRFLPHSKVHKVLLLLYLDLRSPLSNITRGKHRLSLEVKLKRKQLLLKTLLVKMNRKCPTSKKCASEAIFDSFLMMEEEKVPFQCVFMLALAAYFQAQNHGTQVQGFNLQKHLGQCINFLSRQCLGLFI